MTLKALIKTSNHQGRRGGPPKITLTRGQVVFRFSVEATRQGLIKPSQEVTIHIDEARRFIIFKPPLDHELCWRISSSKKAHVMSCRDLAEFLSCGSWDLEVISIGRGKNAHKYTGFYY